MYFSHTQPHSNLGRVGGRSVGVSASVMAKTTAEPYERWRRRLLGDDLAGLRAEYESMKSVEPSPNQCKAFQANLALNRYKNVLLLDDTRVILNDGLAGDYIHANRVEGYKKNGFILTQAPLGKSPIDYWRLVWQERIQVCICLTSMQEDDAEKSVQFFPTSVDRPYRAGPFRLLLTEMEEQKAPRKMIVCRLKVYCWITRCERTVSLVFYGEWPDRGVPDHPDTFLNMLEAVRTLQANLWRQFRAQIDCDKASPMTEQPPLLINCSAGIGRSATLAASLIEMERLRDTRQVDLAATVRRIRNQRAGAVQNVMQYFFIARVLTEVWQRMNDDDEKTVKLYGYSKTVAMS